MEHEQKDNVLESLLEAATFYVETRTTLLKLKAIKKVSELYSNLVASIILFVFFCFFLMLVNIALALWIGEMLGHTCLGFLILGGFYLLLGIIVYAGRSKWLKIPAANALIKKIHA